MNSVIIIPARKGSTRFPDKPLAMVSGKQVLLRSWEIAKSVQLIDEVYIATDDERIQQFAEGFGAKVLFVSGDYRNGTERVFGAYQKLRQKPEIIINFQGDAVLTPPWVVQSIVKAMKDDSSLKIATPAMQFDWTQYETFLKGKINGSTSGTLVVFDQQKNALYFSKAMIPYLRSRAMSKPPVYRHIGLYGYRPSLLETYSALKPSPLEEAEMLEQLRLLENGVSIKVVLVDYQGRTHWSIDNPEDISVVEEIIAREGELV